MNSRVSQMDLRPYLEAYRAVEESFVPTVKQQHYLIGLAQTDQVFPLFSSILDRTIVQWSDISRKEVSLLIRELLKRTQLSNAQLDVMKQMYTDLTEVSKRLKRELTSWEQITVYDFRFLIKSPDRFRLIPIDRPIECHSDYEYGYQLSDYCQDSKMYYLKFYELMMLDYDGITIDQLEQTLSPHFDRYLFRIYSTHNGFHVFVVSHRIHHRIALDTMKVLGCDIYYCLFSSKYGYKIRLSPKLHRDETFLAKYIKEIGTLPADSSLIQLMELHDAFIEQHLDSSGRVHLHTYAGARPCSDWNSPGHSALGVDHEVH